MPRLPPTSPASPCRPSNWQRKTTSCRTFAEASRLGIPLTISTDPRNHFQYVLGASAQNGGFSKWPESLGFGALDDARLTRRFADIARQEYLAVGIQQALSPQIDLASEPRWPRATGTLAKMRRFPGGWRRPMSQASRMARQGSNRQRQRRCQALGRLRRHTQRFRWAQFLWPARRVQGQGFRAACHAVSRAPLPPRWRASCRPIRSSKA